MPTTKINFEKLYRQLHRACNAGDLYRLQTLFGEHLNLIFVDASSSQSPIFRLCSRGHLACLRWLETQPGAKANFREIGAPTQLLFAAAEAGQIDIIKWMLLESPMRARLRPQPGIQHAIQCALQRRHLEIAKFLFAFAQSRGDGLSPDAAFELIDDTLNVAIKFGNLEMLQWTITEAGADWAFSTMGNSKIRNGIRLLYLADQNRQREILGWLVNTLQVAKDLPEDLRKSDAAEIRRIVAAYSVDRLSQLQRRIGECYDEKCDPYQQKLVALREEKKALQEMCEAPHCQAAIRSGLIETVEQLEEFIAAGKTSRRTSKYL